MQQTENSRLKDGTLPFAGKRRVSFAYRAAGANVNTWMVFLS